MKYDKEEKDILDAYESGKMKLSTPSKKEIESIKAIAKNTFKKDKRITIRLYEHDYKGIQKKAMKMGIPYQTLISGIIHRYIEGELVSKSLYRYDTYILDAENSKSSRELWTAFKAQREKELSMLLKELKNQIDSGMLALE